MSTRVSCPKDFRSRIILEFSRQREMMRASGPSPPAPIDHEKFHQREHGVYLPVRGVGSFPDVAYCLTDKGNHRPNERQDDSCWENPLGFPLHGLAPMRGNFPIASL
jgi:hypothetical protein